MLFGRKKKEEVKKPRFDAEKEEPVLLSSICTGEKTAGFRDRETGHFRAVCLIRDEKDFQKFRKEYGVEDTELRTIY